MDKREELAVMERFGTRRWLLAGAVGGAGAALAAWTGARVGFAREQEPGDDQGGHGQEPGDDHGRHGRHHRRHGHEDHHRRSNHR
ncbi:MAG TPA: hypothetical protein VFI22_13770 [Thermomicrobiales bacterium]|nr:hypothetical protein [Thermomicrobiales bacterium]